MRQGKVEARDTRTVWSRIRCSTTKQVPGLVKVEGSYRCPGQHLEITHISGG